MKRGVLISVSLLLGALGLGMSLPTSANAATTIPKSMQGTWFYFSGDEDPGLTRVVLKDKTYDIAFGTFSHGKFVKKWNNKQPLKLANQLTVNKTFTTSKQGKKLILKTKMADWGLITYTYSMKKGHLYQHWEKYDGGFKNAYSSATFKYSKLAHPDKYLSDVYKKGLDPRV
ncbi:hypothetical protein ACFQ44_01885 [Levilactobacillus lanxiensis]|uniref:Uncharacterized protein n=1 Tax=Levilactobacillus lanxiensis TaxID=2799568 RepID=A0ABW4D1J4_9LACO|nr:hypothetical protein [Levilactobacillus lanxiensis]